jgi:hypothetical protein
MKRYFFHTRQSGQMVRDEEGDEFADVEEARKSAISSVRELVAARIKSGLMVSDEQMEVCDEAHVLQFTVTFHDVVQRQLKR